MLIKVPQPRTIFCFTFTFYGWKTLKGKLSRDVDSQDVDFMAQQTHTHVLKEFGAYLSEYDGGFW